MGWDPKAVAWNDLVPHPWKGRVPRQSYEGTAQEQWHTEDLIRRAKPELRSEQSEIFAGGLKDLGRVHIVGSCTAGAALPSIIERLPNGDGFQYAIANYVSKGGEVLEGIGVTPDVEVIPTREALLQGKDPVCEAAIA